MNDKEFKDIIEFLKRNATRGERLAARIEASRAVGRPEGDVMTSQVLYYLFHSGSYQDLTEAQRALFIALQRQVYARIGGDMEVSKQFKQFKKQLA